MTPRLRPPLDTPEFPALNDPISESPRPLRLVCLSDTHGLHRRVTVPDGDILIHAGDLTVFDQPLPEALATVRDVNAWLGELPHPHKVVIAGNHDRVFAR